MGPVAQSALYSLAPVAGMVAGGAAAAWWQPGGRVRSYIQHLAAGVVFAAVSVEVLPDVMHRRGPLAAGIGFAFGVAAMLAIRAMSRRAESSGERSAAGRTPWALVAAVAVDVFVDGMLIGVGFAAGQRQGVLLAVALTGCTVALGLATASDLSRAGASRVHAAALTAGLGLLPAIGAVGGALLARQLTGGWMEAVLSFTCAALLYLVTEELLVEAHEGQEGPETPLATAVFFVGFLALLIAAMMT
jgi:zinc transporter, ZIP family